VLEEADDTQPMPTVVVEPVQPRKKKTNRLGVAIFWSALVAIVLGVFTVIGVYARSGYFIGVNDNNNVVIYRGRVGGMLWFQPTIDTQTKLNIKVLTEGVRRDVLTNITFTSSGQAAKYLMYVQTAIDNSTSTTSTTSTTVAK
jgi:hypothetical protein